MINPQPEETPEEIRSWYGPHGARIGVERPDDQIKSDIIGLIENDPRLDPTEIQVWVDGGVVTISGEADSDEAKEAASSDAWSIPGVVDVHNFLLLSEE